jgi:protein SCO1/2
MGIGLGLALLVVVVFVLLAFSLRRANSSQSWAALDGKSLAFDPDYPRQLTDFSLIDQTGRTIARKDFEGKFLVVGFVFTSCSITCPVVSHQMEHIQALTADQADVKLVSLTVDPDDDTVPVMKQYSGRFGAAPSRWSFLTGDAAMMRNLIGVSFLASDTSSEFAYMPGNFAHIERIVLVDPNGRVQKYYNGLNEGVANAVVAEINRLRTTRQ